MRREPNAAELIQRNALGGRPLLPVAGAVRGWAHEPLLPEAPVPPLDLAPPEPAARAMEPVLPRGPQRGSLQVVTVASAALQALPQPLVDLSDSPDVGEVITLALSIERMSRGAGDILADCFAEITFGTGGGAHTVNVDFARGFQARLPAAALRAIGRMSGVGQYRVVASVGAYAAGHVPVTRTLAAGFAGAGSVDLEVPAFAARLWGMSNVNAGYTLTWMTRQLVAIGQTVVAVGAGESGPFPIPQAADILRVTSAGVQNVRALFELHI